VSPLVGVDTIRPKKVNRKANGINGSPVHPYVSARSPTATFDNENKSAPLKDVLGLMEKIAQAHAGFRSLTEAIDTTSAGGRMMMQIVASFAEFERAMLRERTRSGLAEARKQGRVGGRRHKLRPDQQEEIVSLVNTGQKTAAAAARLFNVHPATISRLLQRSKIP
jgi:DNA invertase Pin-like site-specific DNA recombinase